MSEFGDRCEELRCTSCGFSLLDGRHDDQCDRCGARLCVGCAEAVHNPGCVMGDPTDLDPHEVVKEQLLDVVNRLFEQVYRYNQGTETAFVLMRDAKEHLAKERGQCSDVGHAWPQSDSGSCYACGADRDEQ